ncbi:MAG: beta galactosidase jelly roll domain-containing protein [Bacteroidota bacterium]
MTKRIPNIVWVVFSLLGLVFWFFLQNQFLGMGEDTHSGYNSFHEDPITLSIDFSGEWLFQVGDEMKWKEADWDDSDWASIMAPGYWEDQGYEDYNGFAWYRKKAVIPTSLEEDKLIVLLGKIDDLDQLYINGQLVGSVGLTDDSNKILGNEWQELRGYYIPEGVIQFGEENVFAVRVYDGKVGGGIHEGPIGLITQDNYIQYWNHRRNKRHN